ncbi:MAG: hypothetical protein DRI56_03315 [Chloroflexota bacterium]|nr:MAG: hypothetical protein DRI56_03315 [Chloroflexota bacterium]
MTIEAITFDFWDTLYPYAQPPRPKRRQCIQQALDSLQITHLNSDHITTAMNKAWDTWNHIWLTEYRTPDAASWLKCVLNEIDVTFPKALFEKTVLAAQKVVLTENTIPIDGAHEMLAKLSANYRIGIISDTGLTDGQTARALLEKDGLLPYFTSLTFSDEVGFSKPHPKIFRAALIALDVEPHQAIHIGDLRHNDVSGARGVGMETMRYAYIYDDQDTNYPEADAVIYNYAELENALK